VIKILICPSDGSMPNPPVGTYLNQYYFGLSSYGGSSGTSATTTNGNASLKNGMFFMNSSVKIASVTDGLSQTLMFGERSRRNLPATSTSQSLGGWAWANFFAQEDNTMNGSEPIEGVALHDLNQFGSQHSGGSISNFCLGDGSVRSIRKAVDIVTLQRLCAIADGQVIDESRY
jgi:prepilin-type processing-associated H-X9-DG protein